MIKRRTPVGIYINLFSQARTNYINSTPPPLTDAYSVSCKYIPLEYNLLLFRYVIHNYWVAYNTSIKFYLPYRKFVIVFNEFIDICIWTISHISINRIDKMERIS